MIDIVGCFITANLVNRDRATYDASSSQQVTYTVANPNHIISNKQMLSIS